MQVAAEETINVHRASRAMHAGVAREVTPMNGVSYLCTLLLFSLAVGVGAPIAVILALPPPRGAQCATALTAIANSLGFSIATMQVGSL